MLLLNILYELQLVSHDIHLLLNIIYSFHVGVPHFIHVSLSVLSFLLHSLKLILLTSHSQHLLNHIVLVCVLDPHFQSLPIECLVLPYLLLFFLMILSDLLNLGMHMSVYCKEFASFVPQICNPSS